LAEVSQPLKTLELRWAFHYLHAMVEKSPPLCTSQERELVLMRFAITLLPLGSVMVAYWRCTKVSSWRARGWIIFLYWQSLLLPISFLTASALTGMSMAVADGVLTGMENFGQSFKWFLYAKA
jgi:hypothetical protein